MLHVDLIFQENHPSTKLDITHCYPKTVNMKIWLLLKNSFSVFFFFFWSALPDVFLCVDDSNSCSLIKCLMCFSGSLLGKIPFQELIWKVLKMCRKIHSFVYALKLLWGTFSLHWFGAPPVDKALPILSSACSWSTFVMELWKNNCRLSLGTYPLTTCGFKKLKVTQQ